MKKKIATFIVTIFALFSIHNTAFAYSYGNPNEEKIAQVYKDMVVKLDENPPNYKAAKDIYKTVQEEIDMHMGAEPSKVIYKDFDKEQKDQIIEDMESILALNINRRLSNVDEKFSEYDTSKRLLAKAFATYEALSPKIAAKNKELDTQLRDEFNKALESLGNPGLFGVGQKQANKEEFKKSKDFILDKLKTEFNIKDYKVGHFNAKEDTSAASQKTEWTDLSNLKNWLPIVVIVVVLAAVVIYAIRKRR
ncbi:hypothetical protein [Ectobacillus panaciterrae]|uniref:hypothetical protein n=1 Tax=Ectobacillus panaciterrae TaxID=363872 RepID=UPI0003F8A02D|nr:hypothetical protein [Ectobacillus panaciterrae]